jgi:hypothetical protein
VAKPLNLQSQKWITFQILMFPVGIQDCKVPPIHRSRSMSTAAQNAGTIWNPQVEHGPWRHLSLFASAVSLTVQRRSGF